MISELEVQDVGLAVGLSSVAEGVHAAVMERQVLGRETRAAELHERHSVGFVGGGCVFV